LRWWKAFARGNPAIQFVDVVVGSDIHHLLPKVGEVNTIWLEITPPETSPAAARALTPSNFGVEVAT
jgi:hypothetical protein